MMRIGAVRCLLLAALVAAACGRGAQDPEPGGSSRPQSSSPAVAADVPVPPAYHGELPPLPMTPYPAARPPEVVRAVYEFAARHPEVLSYVPCFCGCERSAGHRDNYGCFVKGRDPSGRPEWDGHGAG